MLAMPRIIGRARVNRLVLRFRSRPMPRLMLPLIVTVLVALAGCAGMSETQQRTLTGGTAGAASGALIGAIAGNAGLGAAIGGAAGLTGGFLYGKHEESKQQAYQEGVSAGKAQTSGSR